MPLKSNIPQLRAAIRDATARGVHRAAGMVRDLARQFAPYDDRPSRPPGPHLRDTIQVEPEQPALRVEVTAGRGLPDPRAILNEYGGDTIFYPAQPYMTPAARAIKVQREVATEIRKAIKRSRVR